MKAKKIIVIGGVASGPAAVAEARRTDPKADITIVEMGPDISYSACEMPLYVSGEIANSERLVRYPVAKFREHFSSTVLTYHQAESINVQKRVVTVRDLATQQERDLSYDKLVLATGSGAVVPEALQISSRDVHVLRSLQDARSVVDTLEGRTIHHAVIIGSGFVGLDVVESLLHRGIRVTILASEGRVLNRSLDGDMSALVVDHLEQQGVSVRSEQAISLDVTPDGSIRAISTDVGEKIGCGFVLIAAGTRPRTELGIQAGLKTGESGAYEVDSQLRTSAPGIWACGDCIEKKDAVTGMSIHAPLALNAFRSGRVAGRNAARSGKGRPAQLGPVVRATAISVGGLEVAHTGWSGEEAQNAGLSAVGETITHRNASSLANHHPLSVRLVAEPSSGKLLGAQIIGVRGAAQRVNIITALLRAGATIDDLYDVDFVYSPRLAPAHDAMMIAARMMQKRLLGTR